MNKTSAVVVFSLALFAMPAFAQHHHQSRMWSTNESDELRARFTTVHLSHTSALKAIYATGDPQKPPVLVLHELPGMTLECLDFARRLSEQGYRVYLPLLFGGFGQRLSRLGMIRVLARRDVNTSCASEVSPMIAIAREGLDVIAREQPGRSIAVIGMCLTGNFGIPLLADSRVASAVLSQPALPLPLGNCRKAAVGVSAADIANAIRSRKPMLVLRFSNDSKSPRERYDALRKTFDEAQLRQFEIPSGPHKDNRWQIPADAHAVLTESYRRAADHPTHEAFDRVVQLLKETLL